MSDPTIKIATEEKPQTDPVISGNREQSIDCCDTTLGQETAPTFSRQKKKVLVGAFFAAAVACVALVVGVTAYVSGQQADQMSEPVNPPSLSGTASSATTGSNQSETSFTDGTEINNNSGGNVPPTEQEAASAPYSGTFQDQATQPQANNTDSNSSNQSSATPSSPSEPQVEDFDVETGDSSVEAPSNNQTDGSVNNGSTINLPIYWFDD